MECGGVFIAKSIPVYTPPVCVHTSRFLSLLADFPDG